jgi:hypothetical protein
MKFGFPGAAYPTVVIIKLQRTIIRAFTDFENIIYLL